MPLIKKTLASDYQKLYLKEAQETIKFFEQKTKDSTVVITEQEVEEAVRDIESALKEVMKLQQSQQ